MLRKDCCMLVLHEGVVMQIDLNVMLVSKKLANKGLYLEVVKVQSMIVCSDP